MPIGTEFDYWNQKCYVSLVGFMFKNVKLKGIKIPFHINFEEVNLRFYVKRFDGEKYKRGVVFIKEIVPRPALSWVANTLYKEHYVTMPMQHLIKKNKNTFDCVYKWKLNNHWNSIKIKAAQEAVEITLGSEAEFITEHYFGYTKASETITYEYEVKHPKWEQFDVIDYEINVDFKNVYGATFDFLKDQKPISIMLAKGSKISVENKKIIR